MTQCSHRKKGGECGAAHSRLSLFLGDCTLSLAGSFLFAFLFSIVAFADDAAFAQIFVPAQNAAITNTAMAYCNTEINANPGQIIYPFVLCLTNYAGPNSADNGFIPATTIAFMTSTAVTGYFLPAVYAMATLLVSLFGIKLMLGDIQNIKGDTFNLVFKIGGVLYFMGNAPTIYGDLLNIMVGFNTIIGQMIQAEAPDAFCTGGGNQTLWQDMDCIFGFFLGLGAVAAIGGIVILLLLLIFTAGTGIFIVFAVLQLIFTLFFSVLRFIQVYVMSIMALSFIYVLGFFFVPLLFFKDTFRYFQKWLSYIMGYVLIPLVMYAYMGMMFVVMQQVIFTGPNSILYEAFGAKSNGAGQLVMPDSPTDLVDPTVPDSNPFGKIQCAKNCTSNSDPTDTTCPSHYCTSQSYSVGHLGVESHSQAVPTDMGTGGTLKYNGQTAHQFDTSGHPTMVDMPFTYNIFDLTQAAIDQADKKSAVQYLIDIAISVVVAGLLAYIMFSLISYIPELASSLVSSGTGAGSQVTRAAVFGEAATMRTLEVASDLTGLLKRAPQEAGALEQEASSAGRVGTRAGGEGAENAEHEAAGEAKQAAEGSQSSENMSPAGQKEEQKEEAQQVTNDTAQNASQDAKDTANAQQSQGNGGGSGE